MKIIRIICTLLFGVAVLLFFGLAYPHHLHYQEQYQLFLFDSSYVWDVVKLPGGIADLLGRFCTQFFLFAWVGAAIIAVVLSVVQLLTQQLACSSTNQAAFPGREWFYGLTFVPSFLLWLFLLDENSLLGGVWAILLTLLASWLFDLAVNKREENQESLDASEHKQVQPKHEQARIKNEISVSWTRYALLVAAIPILYWMVGPVCLVFFLLQVLRPKFSVWYYGVFLLLAIMLIILAFYLPVPASRLWSGIHYHRYPTVFPTLLWAAALSVFVVALVARVFHRSLQAKRKSSSAKSRSAQSKKLKSSISRSAMPLGLSKTFQFSIFLLVSVVMGSLVWKSSNFKAEKVMQYDFMARFQQWNRILETINREKPNNQIAVTVQNLALGMRGLLTKHLFDYNQNGILGLLPDIGTDATSPMPTAEAFYQLGMVTVAQRTVFEAQEAILDFQKSGRCYKRLAETNLILGNYEVARKYLLALQKTLFYREWANETLPLLGDEKAIAKHPEYGRLRQMAYKENFFFGDHVTAEMLNSLFLSNTDNHLALEYLKAYYMLTGDRENYSKLLLEYQ